MNVVFLDIDGVLNNHVDAERHKHASEDPNNMRYSYFYSERCVEELNKLTDMTGAKIVVSSVWRLGQTDEEMAEILKIIGVTGEYLGKTPDLRARSVYRGNEIMDWVKENVDILGVDHYHEFESYVIFDDDSDMLLWQADNFIHVNGFSGLTPRDIYQAVKILRINDIEYEYTRD